MNIHFFVIRNEICTKWDDLQGLYQGYFVPDITTNVIWIHTENQCDKNCNDTMFHKVCYSYQCDVKSAKKDIMLSLPKHD